MTQWADYSAGRPSGAALRAAGFTGAIRYVGVGSSGKRLAPGEYAALTSAGVQVLLVAESGTADAWGTPTDDDRARGRANATAALDDARSLGVPDSVGIAAAADAHALNQGQINDAVAYTRGFEDVLGHERTGFYGFSETLNAVHNAGVASWYWRCGSEPSTADKTWIHFWQRNAAPITRVVSGVPCDINEQYNPVGPSNDSTPTANLQETEDMPDRELRPSANGSVTLTVPADATKLVISLGWTSLTVQKIGFFGPTPPTGTQPAQIWATSGSQRVDGGRPWILDVPVGSVTCEVDYSFAAPAGRDVTGTAGFRK
jgi:hypothetical protein